MSNEVLNIEFFNNIKKIIEEAKHKISKDVNTTMLIAYMNIGKMIVEDEQKGNAKAEYGAASLKLLSKELTNLYGRGFSRSNLQSMRKFYLQYGKCQTLSGKLSWSHYLLLLGVSDKNARSFYEHECENSNWSVRELERQIDSSLYERLLLSKGEHNKKAVLELATKGITYQTPDSFIKDPMVVEFIGIPEDKPMLESDLERALIDHIEDFLLELGRGFMFVGSQQRISVAGMNYYVDMVFYNKILRAYVLIDLKIGKLKPENFGQMNMYVNYYKNEVNDELDAAPIGIILCADKEKEIAEMSMQGLENNIYATKYTSVIPDKEVLENEVRKLLIELNHKDTE